MLKSHSYDTFAIYTLLDVETGASFIRQAQRQRISAQEAAFRHYAVQTPPVGSRCLVNFFTTDKESLLNAFDRVRQIKGAELFIGIPAEPTQPWSQDDKSNLGARPPTPNAEHRLGIWVKPRK